MTTKQYDVVIIGAGLAGLTTALCLAEKDPLLKIAIISKKSFNAGCSPHARSGMTYVQSDDIESFIQDTFQAGGELCDLAAIRKLAEASEETTKWLIQQGIHFDKTSDGKLDLNKGGGHTTARLLHIKDKTGLEITTKLKAQLKNYSNIERFNHHAAVDLIQKDTRCTGVMVINSDGMTQFDAKNTVLATGGTSCIFAQSSNPEGLTGDGIAMGISAGCQTKNLTRTQFHPTCIYDEKNNQKSPLVPEALRSAGAILVRKDGMPFMKEYDQRGDLAPRSVVSQSIIQEIKQSQHPCVYLDTTKVPDLEKRFPGFAKYHQQYKGKIPIAPAAHYSCGGIETSLDGQTDIENLYAIGEVACTGVHGSDRLAGNALLECVVMGRQASEAIYQLCENQKNQTPIKEPEQTHLNLESNESTLSLNMEEIDILTQKIRNIISQHFSIDQTNLSTQTIEVTSQRFSDIRIRAENLLHSHSSTTYAHRLKLVELRNITIVAQQIAEEKKLEFALQPKNQFKPNNTPSTDATLDRALSLSRDNSFAKT